MVLAESGKPVAGSALRLKLRRSEARQALQSLIRRAKAERVGVAVADITICGAVPPYSALLGGKLVAMLAVSPEAVAAYGSRYSTAESVIASSLAGRPIVKPPHLVFLGTTSLYGCEPTQYTRVNVPCDLLGGRHGEALRYRLLGATAGFGTFQFGDDTVELLQTALSQSRRGQRVNSIFGEGTNPRLRKIRDGLDLLNLPSDLLLRHGTPRLVYGVALVRNLRRYLLGQDVQPEYLVPIDRCATSTRHISDWWIKRWVSHRVCRPEVLLEVSRHRLTYPIRHGARVLMPAAEDLLPFEASLADTD